VFLKPANVTVGTLRHQFIDSNKPTLEIKKIQAPKKKIINIPAPECKVVESFDKRMSNDKTILTRPTYIRTILDNDPVYFSRVNQHGTNLFQSN